MLMVHKALCGRQWIKAGLLLGNAWFLLSDALGLGVRSRSGVNHKSRASKASIKWTVHPKMKLIVIFKPVQLSSAEHKKEI